MAICALLVLVGCAEELYQDEEEEEGKSFITKMTLEDLPFLKNELKSKFSGKNFTGREEDYLMFLDTTNIISMTNENNFRTFTFGLSIDEGDKLTNVAIKETAEGYKYYLVTYTSANFEQWIDDIKTRSNSTIIADTEIKDFKNYSSDCMETSAYSVCPSGIHENDDGGCTFADAMWTTIYTYHYFSCDDVGGAGDTAGPGPNGGGGCSGPIITAPTACADCIKDEEDPCVSLNKKSNETKFREKFKDLNSNSRFIKNGETGYSEAPDANGLPIYTYSTAYEGTHRLVIPTNSVSFMHVHNNVNVEEEEDGVRNNIPVKMLSPGDINTFFGSCQVSANNAGVPNTGTYGMMISSEGIFAIKMLVPVQVPSTIMFLADMKIKYDKAAKDIYKNNPGVSNKDIRKEKLQKMLLKLMKENGLEDKVGLYEGTVTPPEPGQPNLPIINWTRKTLDTNGELIETPC